MKQTLPKNECCPEFTPARWDGKTHVWKNKLFLRDDVIQIMHIPVNMGAVIRRMFAKIQKAGVSVPAKDFLMLCYDPSPWKSQVYMTVAASVPGGRMETLSGTFLSRAFDGPYSAVPKWIKIMDQYVAKKGKSVKRYYFHYAYCPGCSKKYGHNWVIAFAQV